MTNNKTFNITHILKFPIINYTQLKTNATSNNKYLFWEAIKLWLKEKSLDNDNVYKLQTQITINVYMFNDSQMYTICSL